MRQAVLLLSSGLDSAANLALAGDGAAGRSEEFRVRLTLTIDYGQKGAVRELEHAARLAKHFNVDHVVFDLKGFVALTGGKSALLGGQQIPVPESLDELSVTTRTASAVWVPNRNGVMISIAAALAESRGLDAVAVGFNAEEAVTFPDNTPEYMDAMSASLRYSTANHVRVVSATAEMTKKQIVARLADRRFPFELLWSCYHADRRHCGRCESCQRLRRAIDSSLKGPALDAALLALFGGDAS
ncbi:MAG: 7-cyano-7-deazaguanine synthase [Deltaproteobacteria bacterium]|nr:7-cyano-7-deazaguanine synthase [Deltaproteobacteria bacterium]